MNIDVQSVPGDPGTQGSGPSPANADPVAIVEAAETVAQEVGDCGEPVKREAAVAAAALTGWDIGVALSQTLERWNQVASGYRDEVGELVRALRDTARRPDPDDGAGRYPEVGRS